MTNNLFMTQNTFWRNELDNSTDLIKTYLLYHPVEAFIHFRFMFSIYSIYLLVHLTVSGVCKL